MSTTFDTAAGEVLAPTMPPAIAQAIVAVCAQIKQIGTDEKNPHGGYSYVSVDRLYQRVGPLMAEAGLALLVDETSSEVREGAKGNPWLFVRYSLSFVHVSGVVSPPMSRSLAMPISGPQAFGAAQSYVEKQALRQIFKIPTGEKDADDVAVDGVPPARARAAAAWRAPPPLPEPPIDVGTVLDPHEIEVPRTALDNDDWITWGRRLGAALNASTDREEGEAWLALNAATLNDCQAAHPGVHKKLTINTQQMRERLPDFLAAGEEVA